MTSAQAPSLGLLLAASPDHPAVAQLVTYAAQALDQEWRTFLFCLHDAVLCLTHPELQSLQTRGLRLSACAYGMEQRRLPLDHRAVYGGLGLLADLLQNASLFATFTSSAVCAPKLNPGAIPSRPRQILVAIHQDPCICNLSAEGLRVAAGLATGRNLELRVVLSPSAARGLLPSRAHPYLDRCRQYLQLLLQNGGRLYALNPTEPSPTAPPLMEAQAIDAPGQTSLTAQAFATLSF